MVDGPSGPSGHPAHRLVHQQPRPEPGPVPIQLLLEVGLTVVPIPVRPQTVTHQLAVGDQ